MDNKNSNTPRVVRTGPKTTGKHRKKPDGKAKKTVKTIFFTISKVILTTILVLTITGCIVGTALTIYVMEFIDSDATINLNMLKMNFTSSVYGLDENGENVEIQSLRQGENRIWVDLDEIPKHVQDAFVYSEDERFYTHTGVDFKRTFAAFVNEMFRMLGMTETKFGASTITQQLIKNINADYDNRGIDKKIQEIVQSMNLDRHYSKEQILELYLNYVGLHYASGVQAGAKYYFNKDVSQLTYAEAAALASTTKSPPKLNPKTNPEENKARRNKFALPKMLEFGTITQAEYDAAIKEELVIAGQSSAGAEGEGGTTPTKKKAQSWYVDAAINDVVADLCKEYNYSKEYAEQLLYTAGYQIYTPMEIKTQAILEKYFDDEKTFAVKGVKPENIPDASMVISDYNGNIVALVGGKGEKTGDRTWNDATMSKRPAGSTIKPLAIYTPAFENNLITWSSIMDDSPVKKVKDEKTGVERDYPKNYNEKYDGPMLIIDALKVSKNTIPVRLCDLLTPKVSYDFITKELGITSLDPANNSNEATLALGDGGFKLHELTAAFQIFGNGGYYTEPKLYTKVTDSEGKVILDATTRSKQQVMSAQTAYIMNKGLWSVVNDGGSGKAAKLANMETIGKTGTSNDRKDLLFMGCTPYYVAGIRYGHDDNKLTIAKNLYSAHIPVWQKIMTEVHKGKNPAQFSLSSEGVVEMPYCVESGGLAHSACPKQGKGYYKTTALPAACTIHGQSPELPESIPESEPEFE
ncbi:MAG: transglycosylase domain-containing protein [Oscillospiraceae bacterium]